MRWFSKPEWNFILVAALGGALAVPFIPLLNNVVKQTIPIIPAPLFWFSGAFMGVTVGLVTWRVMMAGIVVASEEGLTLIRYERNLLLPWTELDCVQLDAFENRSKAKLIMRDSTEHSWNFLRTPKDDFLRMQRKIADPILMHPVEERRAAAAKVLDEHGRDDLILIILRVYAGLVGFMGVTLSCML